MKRIALFCGSSSGADKIYEEQAYLLGKTLAERHIGMVYGGAKVGLMGAAANGALDYKGEVIGVLPHFLQQKELAHQRLTELILVDTMHERKMKMNDLSDGVIALPGGYGTMEELFEIITWSQLGLHKKPVGILNISGFYDPLIELIERMTAAGFLREENKSMLLRATETEDLLEQMNRYRAPEVAKWISKQTS